MCEAATLERIVRTVQSLPEQQAAEILDFAEFVKARYSAPARPAIQEDRAALLTELQAAVEAQPMQAESAGEFIRQMRDGAI